MLMLASVRPGRSMLVLKDSTQPTSLDNEVRAVPDGRPGQSLFTDARLNAFSLIVYILASKCDIAN